MKLPRRPDGHHGAPLEGELLPTAGERVADLSRRFSRPLDILWGVSLLVTGWLLWLALRDGPTGVLDILLALLLCVPFAVLSAARLGLWWMTRSLRETQLEMERQFQSTFGADGAGFDPTDMGAMMERMRQQAAGMAGDWRAAPGRMAGVAGGFMGRMAGMARGFMLTPAFLFAVALSLLATLVMIPVALFTLLLNLF
ncbi:MAG TPA: hypothetical protein ENO16_07765 [Chromatiales bacterium]|nr:hypothetical protein [Chromatiales bacterium]